MCKRQFVKDTIYFVVAIYMLTCIPNIGFAADMSDLREMVQTVREKLVVLLVTTDKAKQAARAENIKQLSQDIDARLQSLLEDEETPEDLKKKLAEFQLVWGTFKIMRDMEIIPYLLSGEEGKIKEAKTIARTIQAERFQKMQSLLQ